MLYKVKKKKERNIVNHTEKLLLAELFKTHMLNCVAFLIMHTGGMIGLLLYLKIQEDRRQLYTPVIHEYKSISVTYRYNVHIDR